MVAASDNKSETGDSNAEVEFFQPLQVSAEDAHTLFQNGVRFIDARNSDQYKKGHIPSSLNIPPDRLEETEVILKTSPRQTPFVVYSDSGSQELNKNLSEVLFGIGFKRIYIFSGGYDDWTKNNFTVWK